MYIMIELINEKSQVRYELFGNNSRAFWGVDANSLNTAIAKIIKRQKKLYVFNRSVARNLTVNRARVDTKLPSNLTVAHFD
jgi:hypothetical protein